MITKNNLAALLLGLSLCLPTWANDDTAANQALIQKAFEDWRAGQGGIFQLLADDAVWVVAGSSPYSGTYRTREAFMEDAVKPITDKLAHPSCPPSARSWRRGLTWSCIGMARRPPGMAVATKTVTPGTCSWRMAGSPESRPFSIPGDWCS